MLDSAITRERHINPTLDVAIIGAGAAGLMTAIGLGRQAPHAAVAALDGAARIGAKILVSGGGRCNVTNVRVTPADFYGGNPNIIRKVLAAFTEQQTRAFFSEIGVPLHEEEDGKLFPDSNQARTVVDALLAEAHQTTTPLPPREGVGGGSGRATASCRAHPQTSLPPAEGAGGGIASQSPTLNPQPSPSRVSVLTLHRVLAVERASDTFQLIVRVGSGPDAPQETWHSRCVVLATGGLSLPKTGSDGLGYELARNLGHSLVPTTPALDPLLLDGDFHAGLSGVSHDVVLTVRTEGAKPTRIAGPLLWTHFGVSGPAALNASRFWHRSRVDGRPVTITANLLGNRNFEQAEQEWLDFAAEQPRAHVQTLLHRWLPARVAAAALATLEIPTAREVGQVSRPDRRRCLNALLEWPLPVIGTRGYKYAEITAGGVPLTEVNASTMESRVCPGLYLVGEVLDVDGRIGGFNFQWAWSSGWVAATALAGRLNAEAMQP